MRRGINIFVTIVTFVIIVVLIVAGCAVLEKGHLFDYLAKHQHVHDPGLDPDKEDTVEIIRNTEAVIGPFYGATAIHQAVDAAQQGDLLLVYQGTYSHVDDPISITGLEITIQGAGRDKVFITGLDDHQVFIIESATVTINDVTIIDGRLDSSGGGGIILADGAMLRLSYVNGINCKAMNGKGGFIDVYQANLIMDHCYLYGNYAKGNGGAVYNHFGSNCRAYDVIYSHNISDAWGGGMQNEDNGDYEDINCVYYRNTAGDRGGALESSAGNYMGYNSIYYQNDAPVASQVAYEEPDEEDVQIEYSCMPSGNAGCSGESPLFDDEPSNINNNPKFRNAPNEDFRLKE
ncbi:hypothetical protein ACFL56_03735, partial [Candidatus Margulisiibacteriota bacterium]